MQASEIGLCKLSSTLIHGRITILVVHKNYIFSSLHVGSKFIFLFSNYLSIIFCSSKSRDSGVLLTCKLRKAKNEATKGKKIGSELNKEIKGTKPHIATLKRKSVLQSTEQTASSTEGCSASSQETFALPPVLR